MLTVPVSAVPHHIRGEEMAKEKDFTQIPSPSSVTHGNPRATMPSLWGFPFPFSPGPPKEMQTEERGG